MRKRKTKTCSFFIVALPLNTVYFTRVLIFTHVEVSPSYNGGYCPDYRSVQRAVAAGSRYCMLYVASVALYSSCYTVL